MGTVSAFHMTRNPSVRTLLCLQYVWLAPSLSALHIARTSIVHTSCDSLALTMPRTHYGLHLLYSSHLLWSANTVGANLLTMVHTYYGTHLLQFALTHRKYIWDTVSALDNIKCEGVMGSVTDAQEVHGSISSNTTCDRVLGLIWSARESHNVGQNARNHIQTSYQVHMDSAVIARRSTIYHRYI